MGWKEALKAVGISVLTALLAVLGSRQVPVQVAAQCPCPPTEKEPEKIGPTKDPLAAIGKLVMAGGSCSGTVISAPDAQAQQLILSAAHCVKSVGETCQYFTRSGSMLSCRVRSINRRSDIAILETEMLRTPLPYMLLAASTPPAGSPVMHCGFGVHQPGNIEKGRVLQSDTGNGQVMFELSVSPGDSGGGICLDGQGRVISPVCCTTRLAAVGQVFGGRPEEVRKMVEQPAFFLDVQPMQMPDPPKVMQ